LNSNEKKTSLVQTSVHTLQLDQRKHAVITGVSDVTSFHETEVVLHVDGGDMILCGNNLHIGKLLLDIGQVIIDGQIDSICYETRVNNARRFLRFGWGSK